MAEQTPMLSICHPLGSRAPRRVPLGALCSMGFDKCEHTEMVFLSLKLSAPRVFLPHPVPSNHGPFSDCSAECLLVRLAPICISAASSSHQQNESLLSARLSLRLLKDGAGVFRVSKQVFMQGTHFQLIENVTAALTFAGTRGRG